MIRRVLVALGAIMCGAICAAPGNAQSVDIFTRSAFHAGAEHLSSDDERFVWDANFGGDVDLVDYGTGRLTFIANYQVVMGEQLKKFDPNQGNYILAGTLSGRFRGVEAAAMFYHQSRHLSDRPKVEPVDWNMFGGRLLKNAAFTRWRLDTRGDLRWTIAKSYVDYDWEFDGGSRATVPLDRRFSVIADGGLRLLGVDGAQNRGTQTGYRAEGGLRIDGKGAAVELFVAGERRIDPYPLEFGTAQWFTAGFRLLSR